jgi:hypothetical protein
LKHSDLDRPETAPSPEDESHRMREAEHRVGRVPGGTHATRTNQGRRAFIQNSEVSGGSSTLKWSM